MDLQAAYDADAAQYSALNHERIGATAQSLASPEEGEPARSVSASAAAAASAGEEPQRQLVQPPHLLDAIADRCCTGLLPALSSHALSRVF